MKSTFQYKMEQASKLWKGAKERASTEGFGSEIEDGIYPAQIIECNIGESKSSGRLQAAWKYKILDGESKGQTIPSFDGLESEDNLMWLARKLAKLNYDAPEDLEAVKEIFAEIESKKPCVQIRIKTKGEYQNVYVDKLLGDEETEGFDSLEAPGETKVVEEEDGEEGVEITVGMNVGFNLKGEDVVGEVLEVIEEEGKARIEVNGKVFRVAVDKLSIQEAPAEEEESVVEEEEIAEEPKKVVKKKPVAKKKGKR